MGKKRDSFEIKTMEEIVYGCALAKSFLYKPQVANLLLEEYGSILEIYRHLNYVNEDGIKQMLEKAFSCQMLDWAEKEVEWCMAKGIELLFYGAERYPKLLLESSTPPFMLYYKGSADLNAPRSVSMVGTRLASAYGKQMCTNIIGHIEKYSPLIFSGLAYGIDIAAHRAALEAGLETVAVLPNGMDSIYPNRHRDDAATMVSQGGILTEFPRGEFPQKMNFIKRNRIIAAISQGVVVVESRVKGGSMITAEFASAYNRDVFAVPGRVTDGNSFGCNYLISKNVAAIYNAPTTIPQTLGWDDIDIPDSSMQPQLFSFDAENKAKILLSLNSVNPSVIEQVCSRTGLDWDTVSVLLLELELEGKINVKNNTDYYLRK